MGEIRNTHIGEIQQLVFNIDGTKEDPLGGLAELVGMFINDIMNFDREVVKCYLLYHISIYQYGGIS